MQKASAIHSRDNHCRSPAKSSTHTSTTIRYTALFAANFCRNENTGARNSPWVTELSHPGQLQAPEHALHARLDRLLGLASCLIHSGDDEVLKHLHVRLVLAHQSHHCGGIDFDPQKLFFPV